MPARRMPILPAVLVFAACGRVGAPLPPLEPIPAAAVDFAVEQSGYELRFRWTNPSTNRDGSPSTDLARVLIADGDAVIADLEAAGAGEPQTFVLPVRDRIGVERAYALYFGTTEGRMSDSSAPVAITVLDVPGGGAPPGARLDQARVRLDWDPPDENTHLAEAYRIYRSGTLLTPEPLTAPGFDDVDFVEGEAYEYVVVPLRNSAAGWIEGVRYPAVELVAVDRTPPSAPVGVTIEPFDGGAFVRWAPSPESDVASYRVYRRAEPGGGFAAVAEWPTTGYADAEYTAAFEYAVSAVDASGNESAMSEPVPGR